MKLSEILKDWPNETKLYYEILHNLPSGKHHEGPDICDDKIADLLSKISSACDREIDREALAKELYREFFNGMSWENLSENSRVIYRANADRFISTMPTWLKRIKE